MIANIDMDNVYYIGVKTNVRDDCQYLSDTYIVNNRVGRGAVGSVYEACKGTDCSYVLKVIIYDKEIYERSGVYLKSQETIENSWINEVAVLQKLNEFSNIRQKSYVPNMFDYWKCIKPTQTCFFILMEKYDGNLIEFMKKYKNSELIEISITFALDSLEEKLYSIHTSCNICLNDIKLDNILYKQLDSKTFLFVFTDTGNSTMNADDSCKKEDTRRFRKNIDEFRESLSS